MVKRILLITLLLIPMHSSAHEWDFFSWLQKSVQNDRRLAECYLYLIDKEYDTFIGDCDINHMALEYADLMNEFYSERDRLHPNMSDADFLADHFEGELLPHVQRNFRLQAEVRSSIMVLILSENILYIDNY